MFFYLYISSGKVLIKKKVSKFDRFFPFMVSVSSIWRLIEALALFFILEVLYKSLNTFLKFYCLRMRSLFSVVSFAIQDGGHVCLCVQCY